MYLSKDVNDFELETKFNAINNDDEKLTKITKAVLTELDTDGYGYLVKAELMVAMASVFRKASIDPPSDAQVEVAMASVFRQASIDPPSDAAVDVATAGVWKKKKTSIVRPSREEDAQVEVAMASDFRQASIDLPSDAVVDDTRAGGLKITYLGPIYAQVDEAVKDLGTDSSGTVTVNGFKKWV